MGEGWQEVLHPDDKENQLRQWQDRSKKGLESSSEFRLLDKKGNTRWVIGKAAPLFNEKGQVSGYIGTLSDITENKKAEEDLRHSEIMLNEAQAIAHISNWEIDLVQNIHTWSDEFYRIYGLNKAETEPSEELFLSFMHPEDSDFAQQKVQEAFASFEDSSFDFRFIRKDNITRYGCTEWRFEFDKKGKPLRLFGILQDITERKEAEDKLKILEDKILGQKIEEQKKIARALITGQEKERNYIGQELHDNINQILAGTKMFLGIAGKKSEEAKEIVKYPMELIDSSIEEIRLLCSKLVTPLKNIDLEELVRDLLSKLDQSKITKTTFTYAVPPDLLSDDLKLNIYRIIQEQVNNIMKYAETKNVNISIKERDNAINIIVEDDGKGFDVKSKRKGIGISNMINRAETFNGWVEIRSSPGEGCKISVSIPY
jgi:PAS domain S-box-containing protein